MIKVRYLIILLGIFLLLGCLNSNYTPTIKKILNPMKQKLVSFYEKNKRYPTIDERNILLKQSGCKIKNNSCYYEGKQFLINSELYNGYSITLKLKNSDCMIGLFKDGDIKNISCQNRGTTDLGQ